MKRLAMLLGIVSLTLAGGVPGLAPAPRTALAQMLMNGAGATFPYPIY